MLSILFKDTKKTRDGPLWLCNNFKENCKKLLKIQEVKRTLAIDFKKISDLAKTAVDKTAEGISKVNDYKKKGGTRNKNNLAGK